MPDQQKSKKTRQTLNQILDAALACYADNGVDKTTLDQVARQAGVARTTLYRYVANRDDLLNQVLYRDARQVHEELALIFRSHEDFGAAIVDASLYNIRGRRTRPINQLLFANPNASVSVSLQAADFYPLARELLEQPFLDGQRAGQIREDISLDMVVEWTTRITLSFINDPGETGYDERKLRALLEAMLLPALLK